MDYLGKFNISSSSGTYECEHFEDTGLHHIRIITPDRHSLVSHGETFDLALAAAYTAIKDYEKQ